LLTFLFSSCLILARLALSRIQAETTNLAIYCKNKHIQLSKKFPRISSIYLLGNSE
jgi:hypothetical protein